MIRCVGEDRLIVAPRGDRPVADTIDGALEAAGLHYHGQVRVRHPIGRARQRHRAQARRECGRGWRVLQIGHAPSPTYDTAARNGEPCSLRLRHCDRWRRSAQRVGGGRHPLGPAGVHDRGSRRRRGAVVARPDSCRDRQLRFQVPRQLKQQALDRNAPSRTRRDRYRPPDKLLAFLKAPDRCRREPVVPPADPRRLPSWPSGRPASAPDKRVWR